MPHHALLAILLTMLTTALAAADRTEYRIRNRWMPDQFLAEADGKVTYGAEAGAARWVVEPAGDGQRIRNAVSGALIVALGEGNAVAALVTVADGDAARAAWEIQDDGEWSALRNRGTGRWLTCERKLGHVECDGTRQPGGDNVWSGQWQLVHAGGPPPPKRFPRGRVSVTAPAYGATVTGDTAVAVRAPGFASLTVRCWQAGEGRGADAVVATVALDAEGTGTFTFPAKDYPFGPTMLRISTGADAKDGDTCNLQLYNTAGKRWKLGLAEVPSPPAAAGLTLAFADDFRGPLSISKTGEGTTYCAHKPGGGDFGSFRFADHEGSASPFLQLDDFLRIRADARSGTAGLISSLRMDGSGLSVPVPCYFECRFTAQSAPGTWPAFWVMTRSVHQGLDKPADEMDTIEAYGGTGKGSPNQTGYWIASHFWNQGEEGKKQPGVYKQVDQLGLTGSSWFTTFHTYGTLITATDTVYYCDDIEVGRHPTGVVSKAEPWFFFINLATGGGWPVNLSRYDGIADMYVDWVRVYKQ